MKPIYIEDFEPEQEVCLKQLKITPNLIKHITFNVQGNTSLINKLKWKELPMILKSGVNDNQTKLNF